MKRIRAFLPTGVTLLFRIYANDISRGVDIFTLTDMSLVGDPVRFAYLNPQTQLNLLD
jgi:hypothetical protein